MWVNMGRDVKGRTTPERRYSKSNARGTMEKSRGLIQSTRERDRESMRSKRRNSDKGTERHDKCVMCAVYSARVLLLKTAGRSRGQQVDEETLGFLVKRRKT